MSEHSKSQPLLLVRNTSYPTYQLIAYAGTKKAPADEALKICVLDTALWLRRRFRELELPEGLKLPAPEAFREFDLESLQSFAVDVGYKLDVVWLSGERTWTLRLTEPDLGSEPGSQAPARTSVPGRLFETNISYSLLPQGVRCSFQTVVHEPEGTSGECEVYRLSVVKTLMRNPDAGLRDRWPLSETPHLLANNDDIKDLRGWLLDTERIMPAVVLAERLCEPKIPDVIPTLDFVRPIGLKQLIPLDIKADETGGEKSAGFPDEEDMLAYRLAGYAHVFKLAADKLESFNKAMGTELAPGGAAVFYPADCGGKTRVYSPDTVNDALFERIICAVTACRRKQPADFSRSVFVPQAYEIERMHILQTHRSNEELVRMLDEQKRALRGEYQEKLLALKDAQEEANKRCDRFREKILSLEDEKSAVVEEMQTQLNALTRENKALLSRIEHFKLKESRPKSTEDIPAWVEGRFAERLIFHDRAKTLISKTPAHEVDMPLLCDALEYLACEYRDLLTGEIDADTHDAECSQKYDRPFKVEPVRDSTIGMYPAEYKIKYYPGQAGKPTESPLDLHLKVGKDPMRIIRIYFLYDKEKKLIVVGSLPKHLSIKSYK